MSYGNTINIPKRVIDRLELRTGDTDGTKKQLLKEDFVGTINRNIVPAHTFSLGLWNNYMSENSNGSFNAGSWLLEIMFKDDSLVEETDDLTVNKISQTSKRMRSRMVKMDNKARMLSPTTVLRASDETGLVYSNKFETAVMEKNQAMNLWVDRKYFELSVKYARANVKAVDTAIDISNSTNTGWADLLIKEIVEITGRLSDGKDVAGNFSNWNETGLIVEKPTVLTTHEYLNKLGTLYLTFKGTGMSETQASEVINSRIQNEGVIKRLDLGAVTFIAVPEINWYDTNAATPGIVLDDGSTNTKPLALITLTGELSPVGGKFYSQIYSWEEQGAYGDIGVNAKLLSAYTGTDIIDGNATNFYTPIFENINYYFYTAVAPVPPIRNAKLGTEMKRDFNKDTVIKENIELENAV